MKQIMINLPQKPSHIVTMQTAHTAQNMVVRGIMNFASSDSKQIRIAMAYPNIDQGKFLLQYL